MGGASAAPTGGILSEYAEAILEAVTLANIGVTVTVEDEGTVRYALISDAAVAILGHSREALIARSPYQVLSPAERARLQAQSEQRRSDGSAAGLSSDPLTETVVERADGRTVPVAYVVTRVMIDGRRAFISFFWDITARRAAEDALRAEEARLRRVFDSAPDGIVVSRDGVVLDANPAAARMLGFELGKELVGTSLRDLMSPSDNKAMTDRTAAAAHQRAPLVPRAYEARRRDGSRVLAEITSVPYEHDGQPAIMGFARDVTDRARLQAQLAQSERLAALGTLAAGVAHEINNPLTVIALGIHALQTRLQRAIDGSDAAERVDVGSLLGEVSGCVSRVAGIVRELRAFSRTDDDAPGPTDVLVALAAAERMAVYQLRHRTRVYSDYGAVPLVAGHARRLEQVFVNLLLNAAQAMPEGRAENRIDVRAYVATDGRVAIEVTDNGPGMSAEVLSRVFDPFFTTKRVGEGTGLGLAISHGIVMRLGGDIVLESEVGKGTTARVLLAPSAAIAVVAGAEEAHATAETRGARSRVLIVDDEPALAASLRMLLADEHDVTTVTGGAAACSVLLQGPLFDIVLCDVMMPGVTGMDVYARVAAARPDLLPRIVFMSGGAYTPRATAFLASVSNRVLEKPFGLNDVRRILSEVGRSG